jgi:hydrogenase maturation protein HypF
MYGIDDSQLVADRHPEYFTTVWAETQTDSLLRIQHHHAHIVAGMLEHGWLDRQVLGVAFDGTGFGDDGTIWGGEFMLCTATGFERVGHLRPFSLPGGERAVREPWRVATALVQQAAGDDAAFRLKFATADSRSLLPVLRKPAFTTTTNSAGRLFDGVASLILGIERAEFEGQAAMLLEAVCDLSELNAYELAIATEPTRQIDWRPLVRQVLRDRAAGVSPGAMAMRFHRGLATAIFQSCRAYPALPVVLGGGVFQNRVLVELLAEHFSASDQMLGLPGTIPTNDGGLAAGQLAFAAASVRQRRTAPCA